MGEVNIEFNDAFVRGMDFMEKNRQKVLLTGRAVTEKSTPLTHFRTRKQVAVLAPTGVAAVIHSRFRENDRREKIGFLLKKPTTWFRFWCVTWFIAARFSRRVLLS